MYIVYGMRAKCTCGNMENYITTQKSHGVLFKEQPVMNANDHVKGVNLTHFGDCSSQELYDNKMKEIEEEYAAEEDDNIFDWLGKGIGEFFSKAGTELEMLVSPKCELDTPTPWIFTNEEHLIEGAPALTIDSQCACRHGGVISIIMPEEEPEATMTEPVDGSAE